MKRTNESIIDTILILKKIWSHNKDLRLGQLLGNLHEDLYFMEDDVLMDKLLAFYGEDRKTKTKKES